MMAGKHGVFPIIMFRFGGYVVLMSDCRFMKETLNGHHNCGPLKLCAITTETPLNFSFNLVFDGHEIIWQVKHAFASRAFNVT